MILLVMESHGVMSRMGKELDLCLGKITLTAVSRMDLRHWRNGEDCHIDSGSNEGPRISGDKVRQLGEIIKTEVICWLSGVGVGGGKPGKWAKHSIVRSGLRRNMLWSYWHIYDCHGNGESGQGQHLGGTDIEEKEGQRLRRSIWEGGRRTSKEDAVKAPGGVS